jgi:hypothetical protein
MTGNFEALASHAATFATAGTPGFITPSNAAASSPTQTVAR